MGAWIREDISFVKQDYNIGDYVFVQGRMLWHLPRRCQWESAKVVDKKYMEYAPYGPSLDDMTVQHGAMYYLIRYDDRELNDPRWGGLWLRAECLKPLNI